MENVGLTFEETARDLDEVIEEVTDDAGKVFRQLMEKASKGVDNFIIGTLCAVTVIQYEDSYIVQVFIYCYTLKQSFSLHCAHDNFIPYFFYLNKKM